MLDQELSQMDRITQLQDGIDQLLVIMSSSIHYLVNKTALRQVSPDIPVIRQREKADPEPVFEANQKELVNDLIRKAKQVEYLIESLPGPDPEEGQAQRLEELETAMQKANSEYIEALDRARRLHKEVTDTLRMMLSDTESSDPAP
ncbi:hypothetical protein BOTBODRAFT_155686 [Botryobasidium botryosum FD-172 SS1]|uniref:Mediator of RNA polymerase II transcription subunit 21 n=1 Tax=Botryobasidium botryosum (strain FD-172 SS1) TaxID=930990 RepID=A0A067N1E2_BOTB1|nr:hypothetical protein BOTBODRAFT_155686 [Botryobasidium botryosum FD-172 SS1]